jgi:hypothetical protein
MCEPSFWDPDEVSPEGQLRGCPNNTMCATTTLRHLKINISGEGFFPSANSAKGNPTFWSTSPPLPRKVKWEKVPHKSLRKLLDKIVDFNPIICHTP